MPERDQSSRLIWHEDDSSFCDFFASSSCCGEANEYRITQTVIDARLVKEEEEKIIEAITHYFFEAVFSPQHGTNVALGVFTDLDEAKAACARHHTEWFQ